MARISLPRAFALFLLFLGGLVAGCGSGAELSPSPIAASASAAASAAAGSSATPHAGTTPTAVATATGSGGVATMTPVASPSPSPTSGSSATQTCIPGMNPASTAVTRTPVTLKSYNVDPAKIFVSGISSGGFMGVQMHVAHSSVFKGAAIYAGGVFYCAQDSLGLALVDCGGETNVDCQALYENELSQSENYLDTQSAAGTIDNESHLKGQPVYLWSGTKDQVVNPQSMNDLDAEYVHYGANVTYENTYPANHGWESPDGEVPCPTATEPYMVSCASQNGAPYDSVKTWLTMFFGTLNPRNNGTLGGQLINFDQTEFGAAASNAMDTNGFLYVPQSCNAGAKCGFVLALHGCIQNQQIIGTKFVQEAGLNEWADTNNIIVMYPYAIESTATTALNPMGCWDWWGYDDPNYALKTGTQLRAIYKMVQRVTGAP